jgi:sugar/nucleoside kinase (ribokinase family)
MSGNRTIVTAGEILVEFVSHHPNCALEKIAEYSGPYPSGAPAIFLNQAARMGASTEMIGGVGADGFGNSVLQRLKADGVGVQNVNISEKRTTGVAFVSYYDSGERDFIFHLGGTAAEDFEIPQTLFNQSDAILHVSASSLGAAPMREKIMTAVRQLADAGGWITCDPNARPELLKDKPAMDAMHEVIERSYCLMPSIDDLKFLFPDLGEEEAIKRLLDTNAKVVTIKRGPTGATVVGNGERYDFEAHGVEEIDPTGAGDSFCGTFIALLSQGASLNDAGRLANAAGAIAVTRRGPMEGNSSTQEITRFLDNTTSEKLAP